VRRYDPDRVMALVLFAVVVVLVLVVLASCGVGEDHGPTLPPLGATSTTI
jgi:hypothetical protein